MYRLIWAVALAMVCLAAPASQPNAPEQPLSTIERRVFDLVNQERTSRGLNALQWDQRVADAALAHARNMARLGYFSHVDPVHGSLVQRLKEANIPWHKMAENLFTEKGYPDPAQRTVQGWLHSPGHRRNMLDKEVTRAGVGAARTQDGTVYVDEIFIRP